ncbi:MAG TPA: pitrilysin family protein [Longimicrobiales bacterium]
MRSKIEAGVHLYALDNGGRAVIKRKSNIPLVTIAIGGRGGVHDESIENAGLTGLMARTSVKGTATRTAAEIAQAAEEMGGSISPSVSSDVVDWQITVPAKHFERALDLLADVAFHAAFPEKEFDVERKLALSDVQQTRDDMYRYPLRLCLEQAFRDHPYGNTIESVERSLTRATASDVAAWHKQQVYSEPWMFVVGDVDPDAAARAVDAITPRAHANGRTSQQQIVWGGPSIHAEQRDKTQTALAIAFPGPPHDDPDVYALHVLSNAVGGLGGRFFEELRSKRSLAYTVSLMPVSRWLGGAFIAYIATAPEREDEARSALLEEFARLLAEPLPEDEVARAQRYTIGTWQIRGQTNSSQLGDLVDAYLLGDGVREITEFEERIRSVTPQRIQAAARKYFDPSQLVEGIVRGKAQ